MTTSNTYNFDPSLGELVVHAFNMIEVRPTAITQEHMQSARMSANLLLSNWSNQGVNLWAVDLIEKPLIQGQSAYDVDANTVMVLDAYITIAQGNQNTDRVILPVSRTEYASYPNKEQQGFPTTYWFDRLNQTTSPSAANTAKMYLWPVPDGGEATVLKYYRVKRLQDANFTAGQTLDIPYLWMEAFAYNLALRLAMIWNPQKVVMLKPLADEAYQIAAAQNTEYVTQYIAPQLSGYFR